MSEISVLYPQLCAIDKDDNYIKGKDEYFWYASSRTIDSYLYIAFMNSNILPSPGMAMRRKVVETIFPLPYSLVNFQDYAMHIDILMSGFKIYVLDEILVDYRIFDDGTNMSLNNDTATKREQVEVAPLMDYFLKIKDIKLLKRIFKDEIVSTKIEPFSDTIPFFLGQMALLSPHFKRKEWGYHTIMKFLNDKKNFDIANKRYGFTFKNYLNLVKNLPLLETTEIKEKYFRKYKKYRKFFKIATIVIFIEILTIIWFLLL